MPYRTTFTDDDFSKFNEYSKKKGNECLDISNVAMYMEPGNGVIHVIFYAENDKLLAKFLGEFSKYFPDKPVWHVEDCKKEKTAEYLELERSGTRFVECD